MNAFLFYKYRVGSYNDYDEESLVESDRLAQRLGYVNPVEYEFVYLEPKK